MNTDIDTLYSDYNNGMFFSELGQKYNINSRKIIRIFDILKLKRRSVSDNTKLFNEIKLKKIIKEKYGVENVFQNEEIKQKIRETHLEKYGVDNYSKTKEYKEKIKETCLEKYGVENVFQNEKIKNKIKETCLEKYGVENPFQLEKVIEISKNRNWTERNLKSKKTCLEKYGVTSFSKTILFAQKRRKLYKCDNENFDSSWELAFYLYHKDMGHNIKHENHVFKYFYKNVEHSYILDFEIDGIFYEIKGDYFFENGKMINPFNRNLDGKSEAKYQCGLLNNVKFLTFKDLTKEIDYFNNKYGELYGKITCKKKN